MPETPMELAIEVRCAMGGHGGGCQCPELELDANEQHFADGLGWEGEHVPAEYFDNIDGLIRASREHLRARLADAEAIVQRLRDALAWTIGQLDGYDERDGWRHRSPPEIEARAALADAETPRSTRLEPEGA